MGSITLIDLGQIAHQLGLPAAGVEAVVRLLDEGNTVPFITRYRRDPTGGFDEVDIRRIIECVFKARQLADRKQTIVRTIEGQGKLTPELLSKIEAVDNTKQLEDIYLPFKPLKMSLAEIARQRRLDPLAREIMTADPIATDLDKRSADFIDSDGQVAAAADALLGVGHIIADEFSANADLRQCLRSILYKKAHLKSQRVESEGKALSKDEKHFRDYFDYSEHIQRVPPHRALAINRGERAKLLKVRVDGPTEEVHAAAEQMLVPPDHPHADFLKGCVRDALARLVLPSLEREIRREITQYCESHAVEVFAKNLRNLLLQPPFTGRRVLALDPGFKSGCKAVALDECGIPLEHAVLHIIGQKEKRDAAAQKIVEMVTTHNCTVVAVGNGTAGRETESLVAELVAGELKVLDVGYVIVNEAGASVYSTSVYAREELPAHEAAVRGAISIGRRLQDPLSELVKIEPANIGVGLYQHDVKARHLHASLDAVVESCVNYVGVDVNTASPALLRYVSGLNQTMAKGFHEWRTKNGAFTSRQQFREIPGFGEAAFVQSVGFLKITGGVNPLDSTWIHPESYAVAEKVLEKLGGTPQDLMSRQQVEELAKRASNLNLQILSAELGVGRLLLSDIIEQLARPGRDPRDDLPKPFFKKGVLKLEDLEMGMELLGSVLNVVDFGAFVDIGMHDSGLVHISQLSNQYVRDPHDVVSVGQIVKVWVLELDKARRRVALTMIAPGQQQDHRNSAPSAGHQQEEPNGSARGRREGARPRTQSVEPAKARGMPAGRPGPSRPSQPSRGREGRQAREQQPKTYTAGGPSKPAALITKAMKEGKEPLRTFGDLKQFLEKPAAEKKQSLPEPQADRVTDPQDGQPAAE
ncbi:MAG: RNA-binding transcriptional accessory protein [Planctomycetota bacterium]|nr:MAG: RNA-binding transcriptional accessory protein [Planctomycetota bacterium]